LKVTLCGSPFESQAQVTDDPVATVKDEGLNRSFCTMTSPLGGGLLPPSDGPVELLPHPDANSTDAAHNAGISQ
jgi:hypothetical protein